MSRAARAVAAVILMGGLFALAVAAPGQSPLGEAAKEELSEQAGIPLDMLATMVVTDGADQFILAFVAAAPSVLESNLSEELKDGVRPFVGTPALLALVYPTQASRFDPRRISFAQGDARFLIDASDITPLTENFRAGQLSAETLSAGVIELPEQLDESQAFEIVFRGAFTASIQPTFGNNAHRSSSQMTAVVRQDGRAWTLAPLQTSASLGEVYQYENFSSQSPLVRENASILLLHQNADGTLSLVTIHQARRPAEVKLTLWGLPPDATFAIQDDPDDAYWLDPPSAKATWRWSSGKTDGGAISGLTDGTSLSVRPAFNDSISTWYLVRGSVSDPEYVELPSTSSPLQLVISRVGSSSAESEEEDEKPEGAPNELSAEMAIRPSQPEVGQTVTFDAGASTAPSAEIVEYAWDFDADGRLDERGERASATHAYRSAGTYRVKLQITDDQGRTATATRTVDVGRASRPASVDRIIGAYLPESQALPGSSFHVRLKVQAHRRTVGLGVRERPPEGWQLTPVQNAGAEFNRELGEWLFTDPLRASQTRTILYRVDVPERAKPGTFRFAGQAFSGVPAMQTELGGDAIAEVVHALPIRVAVSRLNDDGGLDLRRSNRITFGQMLQATVLWKEQARVPGTDGRTIDLPTMVTLVAYWRTRTPVDRPLPADDR